MMRAFMPLQTALVYTRLIAHMGGYALVYRSTAHVIGRVQLDRTRRLVIVRY